LHAEKSGRPEFEDGSPASTDAATIDPQWIGTLLEEVRFHYLSVFDNAAALVRLGEAASRGEASPAFIQYAIARSVLEALAEVWWLLDDTIDASVRIGRLFTLLRYELRSQQALKMGSFKEDLAEIDAAAAALNLSKVGEDFQVGYGAERPSHGALVKALEGSGDTYALLSAATHGESWAVLNLGYRVEEDIGDGFTRMTKSPPAVGYYFAIAEAYSALSRCIVQEARYRGWDPLPFIASTQKADAEAGF
jgi:hypothetical protein